jgi:diguanylate cyclase (GGDEF)-like protein
VTASHLEPVGARNAGAVPWAAATVGLLIAVQAFRCAPSTVPATAAFAGTVLGLAAIAASMAARRPATAPAWLFLAAGRGAIAAGVIGGTFTDAVTISGYACCAYGLLLLARCLTRVWDPTRWIDSTVVALSAGASATGIAVAGGAIGTWADRWLDPALPALDLFLVLLATRSVLAVRPRSASLRLLTAGLVVQLAGSVAVEWLGAPDPLTAWTTAVATLVIAAGAVHPSVLRAPQQVLPWRKLGWVRFTVLVAALAAPLFTLVALVGAGRAPATVVVALAASTAVIAGLVLLRVGGLVSYADDLADARHRSRFQALAEHSHDATVIVGRDGLITWASPAVRSVLDREPTIVIGEPLSVLVGRATAQGLEDEAVEGLVLVLRDVTERVLMQEQLVNQALVDPLTGLANRALFTDRLEHALAQPSNGAVHQLAVLFIDLDDFKRINDSLGHGLGDDVLVTVARRIADALAPSDTAARFGGDEFAVLVERVDADQARAAARQVLDLLAVPMTVGNYPVSITASVGIAVPEHPGQPAAVLLRNADLAMYEAKRDGKGTARTFRSEMHERELRQFTFRSEVGAALDRGQLHLLYQPIVDMGTEQVTGAEALIRWEHPEHGLISPLDFIPVAEATRAIVPIGRWVLRTACAQLAAWKGSLGPLTMDVNVSAVQLLDPGFVDDVRAILADTGVDDRSRGASSPSPTASASTRSPRASRPAPKRWTSPRWPACTARGTTTAVPSPPTPSPTSHPRGRANRSELLHEAEAAGTDAGLGVGEVDGELRAVGGEHVLADEDRRPGRIRGDPLAHEHRGADGDLQQVGVERAGRVGADGLGGTAEVHREQLVERSLLDLGPAEVRAQLFGAPHGDAGEGLAVGQVDPAHPQGLVDPERGPHPRRRADEGEVEDLALRGSPLGLELLLDGGEVGERLAHRAPGDEPAEALARVDEALVAQVLERLADGHSGGAVGCRQLRFRRQQPSGCVLAALHPRPEVLGDVSVPDRAHLSHSCMLCLAAQAVPRRNPNPRGAPWPSAQPPPSSSSTRCTPSSANAWRSGASGSAGR